MSQLTIDLLSDTHGQHKNFTCRGGDILIHAGDCTATGDIYDARDFLDWFAEQNYEHLIMIPGNHDRVFEKDPKRMKRECLGRYITLLNDSGIIIKSMADPALNLKIWG